MHILFTHSPATHENDLPGDLDPVRLAGAGEVDIVVHGHTHLPLAELRGKVMWVNPGHLRRKDKKGAPASYAVLEMEEGRARARIIELTTGRELTGEMLGE
jgi:putative phosphoesterase